MSSFCVGRRIGVLGRTRCQKGIWTCCWFYWFCWFWSLLLNLYMRVFDAAAAAKDAVPAAALRDTSKYASYDVLHDTDHEPGRSYDQIS